MSQDIKMFSCLKLTCHKNEMFLLEYKSFEEIATGQLAFGKNLRGIDFCINICPSVRLEVNKNVYYTLRHNWLPVE